MDLTVAVGLPAVAACHFAAFWFYFRQIRNGASRPNPASWTVWTALSLLNLVSYGVMTRDFALASVALVPTVGCVAVLVHVWRHEKCQALDLTDYVACALGLSAVPAWVYFREATAANLIVQAAEFIGFVPTFRDLVTRRRRESPPSWAAWSVAYVITLVMVAMRWKGHAADAVYPVLSLVNHFAVLVVAVVLLRRAR